MNSDTSYFALFMMGLLSGAHCVGMCGGIMASLSMAIPAEQKRKLIAISFAYNLGRITSYAVIGAGFGLFTQLIGDLSDIKLFTLLLRVIAGLLLIATGLYISQWWLGLNLLEKVGAKLWIYLQPISKKILPVNNIQQGFLLGCVWGWLPCGLVYAALALAITHANAIQSAWAMLAFGLGTFPTVVAAGIFSSFALQPFKNFLQQKWLRIIVALGFILFGVWTIYVAVQHFGHNHSAEESSTDHSHMDHEHMHH